MSTTSEESKKQIKDLAIGAGAGAGAAAIVMPIDNFADEYKTRHSEITKLEAGKASSSKLNVAHERAKMSTIAKDFAHKPSMAYRSMSLKLLKIAPAVALQFYIYNKLKDMNKTAASIDTDVRITKHLTPDEERRAALDAHLVAVRNSYAQQNALVLEALSHKLQGDR